MNKTKIEWCDYTINPVKGMCPVGCPYCYARAMYKRFKRDESLSYHDEVFKGVHSLRTTSRIFVGSTIDLFHDKTSGLIPRILEHARHSPWHTFIFLTKCPENLIECSPFQDNCWIGCSCTDQMMFTVAADYLAMIEAKVKFVSFEPLLGQIDYGGTTWQEFMLSGINWVIIGQQTPVRKSTMPKPEWIHDIVDAADKVDIPVFLKNNLYSVLKSDPAHLRQQWPEVKK